MPNRTRGLVFSWDGWSFEPAEWRLLNSVGEPVQLPNKTLDLLALLLDRSPGLVGKDEILSRVWGDAVVEEGNIAFHVASLRKALDRDAATSCIETVRGRGYRFVADVTQGGFGIEPATAAPPGIAKAHEPAVPPTARRPRLSLYAILTLAAIVGGLTWWSATLATSSVNDTPPDVSAMVLEGRMLWSLRKPADVQQAIRVLDRAVSVNPQYAPAYAALADAYNLTMSGLPTAVRYERAKFNAERAVALAPGLAEGHTSLGFLRYKFEWRWDDAIAEFERAIALNPNYALAHHWYGELLGILGRNDDAIRELRTAIALNPESLAIQSDLVTPLLAAGRVLEARQVVESAARTNSTGHWIPYRMAQVLAAEGQERASLEEHWRWLILTGATLDSVEERRAAYRAGGKAAVLRLEISRMLAEEAANPNSWLGATNLSLAYSQLGERVEAFRWISKAIDRREDAALLLLTYREYDALRGDPEYVRQLARVGLKPLPGK